MSPCTSSCTSSLSETAKWDLDRIKSSLFLAAQFTGCFTFCFFFSLQQLLFLSLCIYFFLNPHLSPSTSVLSFCFVWIPGTSHTPSGPPHWLGCWSNTHHMWLTLSPSSFISPHTDINTSRGALNAGFSFSSRCSLPGFRVPLAPLGSQSGSIDAQDGSRVVPHPASGLPWLEVWPSECAFLMLPWPQWGRWLVELIVAAGPNGNSVVRAGEGDGKGAVVLLNLAVCFSPKGPCSCSHSLCLFIS